MVWRRDVGCGRGDIGWREEKGGYVESGNMGLMWGGEGTLEEKRDMEKWREGHRDMLGRGRECVGAAMSGRTQLG